MIFLKVVTKGLFVEKTPYSTLYSVSLQCLLHVTSGVDPH
ncbi:hypothetical protein [Polaromonas sp. CG9_12]|nr:hypothetical protein [Polaromonas sp. CG9_12]